MRLLARPHQLPGRIAVGAFILNSGLRKAKADKETAVQLHGMAARTYPFLAGQDPEQFTATLSKAEIALGTALLLPFVPSLLAGAALSAFSGGLLGLYVRTPGMHENLRPTQQGTALAKDVWMLGIGLTLLAEELGD